MSRSSSRTRAHDDHDCKRAICHVNGTPSLVPLVAAGAGAWQCPSRPRRQQDNQHTTNITPRSGSDAAATTADSAGARGVCAEQGHQRRHRPVDQSSTASSSTAPIIHGAPADATTRPPRPAIAAASAPGLRLRRHWVDTRIRPGRMTWMTSSALTGRDLCAPAFLRSRTLAKSGASTTAQQPT